ncbi:MAG: YraN family protein [Treponema sp.]|nr:YraN family protein [Treponema sp.]
MHNKAVGKEGEKKAVIFLQNTGYEIIETNWQVRTGEIDIIALKNDTLVFVEVKSLPNGNTELLQHVLGKIKQKKIIETAKRFLDFNRKYSNSYIRFDVLVVDMPGLEPVHHIENAFSELL